MKSLDTSKSRITCLGRVWWLAFCLGGRMSKKKERGAAAVELALLLPVLMAILLGTIEFGFAFYTQASVAGAAREGVRNYAINKVVSSAKSVATAATPDPSKVAAVVVTPAPCISGAQATLTVTYQYKSLTGWFDGLLGSNVVITGKGSMLCGG